MKTKGFANHVDIHIGERLKAIRKKKNLSQSAIANAIDVTFQQVQKYEKGKNRISASKLYALAKFLKVPMTYFFKELEEC